MGIPTITKGPVALYFGGKEIINKLSTDTVTQSNTPFFFWLVLFPVLHFSLEVYKRFRFRKGIQYVQHLRQTVMSGVRNVYGQAMMVIVFLVWVVYFWLHIFISSVTKDLKNSNELSFVGPSMLIIIFSIMVVPPFMRNPKLRFEIKS